MIRSLFISHIQNARESLRSNRLRSALTMIGVAIGVASITAILSLGAGASNIVSRQVDELGGNIAVVRPLSPADNPISHLTQLQTPNSFTASTLSKSDVNKLRNIEHVQAVAPIMVLTGAVRGDSSTSSNITIVATDPELEKVNDMTVRLGQFLDSSLRPDTAVIGSQASVELFGTEDSIGKRVNIRGEGFTIVGVLERTNDPINYNNIDFDSAVFMTTDSAESLHPSGLQIQQVNIKSDSVEHLSDVVVASKKQLLFNHDGQADFTILTGEQIAQPTSQLFYTIAGVTTAVAAISLLVGGIGIMNIMLVSVAERTREIGIRKALGASNNDIVWQFLIESLALSLGGGLLGFASGCAISFIISIFLTFDPSVNWFIVAIAFGISITIGGIFGLYPAIRAAKKDPINALRQYD